jgi:mannose-6-phosphate isomerase-like protein (cupin superfamily)
VGESARSAVVRRAGEGHSFAIGGSTNTVRLAGGESDGRVGVVEMEFPPGFTGPPPHRHERIDHVWYLVRGTLEVEISGRRSVLAAGDSAFVPHGVIHAFANPGGSPAVLLEVDTPGTLDAYLAELAEAFPAGTDVDQRIVAEIQRRHDTVPVRG